MTIRPGPALALALSLILGLAACGESPQQVPASPPPALAGTVELVGELATLEAGHVFLIGRRAGGGPMVLVEKLSLEGVEAGASGERVLPFELRTSHALDGGQVAELELEVRVDLDGLADGTEDVLASVSVPVRIGELGVRVRLDDTSRTEVPIDG